MSTRKSGLPKALLVAVLLTVALAACTSVQAAAGTEPQNTGIPTGVQTNTVSSGYITVVGVGKIRLKPDVAEVNVGAEAKAPTVAEARNEVERRMTAILAALKELGIAEKDIQTSQYSIYYEREPVPVVDREGTQAENQGGYHVANMINVTVRNIDQADSVLDAVVEAGANQVYGISFTVSDEQEWEGQAREKAMVDAKARGADLARLAGVQLGKVASVSEVIGGSPVMFRGAADQAYGGGGIAPGELEMSMQIEVSFAIQ